MDDASIQQQAVETLEDLGLREYEAKCYVALTKVSTGTARDVSECIDVPRTRVYEAVRVLESKGLVEIQHSSPQLFRAIAPEEAVSLLRQRYASRIDTLERLLGQIQAAGESADPGSDHEVWSLEDTEAIDTRTATLLEDSEEEALLFVGDSEILSENLRTLLSETCDRDIEFAIGAGSADVVAALSDTVSESCVFVPDLPLFEDDGDDVTLGRLVVVDDGTVLASTMPDGSHRGRERAIYGDGVDNGLVVMARRLLEAELAD